MITVFPNITNTTSGVNVTAKMVVDSIKQGGLMNKTKDLVNVVRKTADKNKRNSVKGQLPCIMWSGEFKQRKKSGLIKHSGLICLDFDDVDDVEKTKAEICKDKHTYCCFISPSGMGLKVVVQIPAIAQQHQSYFYALADHYSFVDIDSSAKDVSRVCYSSHDPQIYFNPESVVFEKMKAPVKRVKKSAPVATTASLQSSEALKVVKKAVDKQIDFKPGKKHEHLLKFAGFANRAGIPEHETISFYNSNYKKDDVERIVSNIYRNYSVDHNTEPITPQASVIAKPTYKKPAAPVDGSKPDDEKEYYTFWNVVSDKKVGAKPVFLRQRFITFLKDNGFARYHYTGKNWVLVRHQCNIVDKIDKSQLKEFVFDYIENLPDEFDGITRAQLYELIARGVSSFFSDELLEILKPMQIDTHRDNSGACYIYFQNCVLKGTAQGVNIIDYKDLDGYVWKNQIIERNYSVVENQDNDYKELLHVVSGSKDKDQHKTIFAQRLASIESVVGFLLHSYKDPRYCPAIIINDQYINEDNPEGGTGKGLFLNGISHLKRMHKINGKIHKLDSNFPFQGIDVDTQIMVFEDVVKGWNFETLFSIITEGITIEKKGKDAFFIDFKHSAKTVVTTNYTLKGEGNSHNRRRLELEFHGYFRDNEPFKHFGHRLFDDWDEAHWLRFDNYMMHCLVQFLKSGLKKPPVINLNERRLRERTHPEFVEFMDSWIKTGRFTSKDFHDALNKQNSDFERYKQGTITKWIKIYLKHLDIDFDIKRYNTGLGYFRGFEVTNIPVRVKNEVVKKVVKKNDLPVIDELGDDEAFNRLLED